MKLNAEQQEALTHLDGPVRIIAGAGTGKTFTLIHRVDALVKSGKVREGKILLLTFTNKAANELSERLVKMGHKGIKAMTFHSLAARLLKKYWCEDFEILDEKSREEIIKNLMDKFELVRSKKLIKRPENNPLLYKKYTDVLKERNALDFSLLMPSLLEFWEENPTILEKCQRLFDYVLVDEYQDVNDVQIGILKKLTELHSNICVVGDSDQTIYSWRGADASTLCDFAAEFNCVRTIILNKNYRNPPHILSAANCLIENNSNRFEKALKATVSNSEKINYWSLSDEYEQEEAISFCLENYFGAISSMHDAHDLDHKSKGRGFMDLAILYRSQLEGRIIAELLAKKGYPYQISNNEYFWNKKEVRGFMAELSVLRNYKFVRDQKFSSWLGERIDDFVKAGKFSGTQISRLNQLVIYAIAYDSLSLKEALLQFIVEYEIVEDQDNLIFDNKINLLTLHAAKGLEFPIVMIIGLEEGALPSKKSINDEYMLEEERRLMFVGMTRATEELHLFSRSKFRSEKKDQSRFISEIPLDFIEYKSLPSQRMDRLKRKSAKRAQIKMF
ncbi:AAA family ATPase [Candidatus Peregrinibacteria bacterium]|nr:AAA family ATPase [Candidatus Peregrinibacteria bacterium]